jgi:hypothetical protein
MDCDGMDSLSVSGGFMRVEEGGQVKLSSVEAHPFLHRGTEFVLCFKSESCELKPW